MMNSAKMQAIVCTKYGGPEVLELQEVDKPQPKDQEVLVRVYAASITTADTLMRKADPFIARFFLGLTKPRHSIMGTGFAGVVEAIGASVTRFEVGQPVFGETATNFSANAEYVAVSEKGVILNKPASLSYEEAATICDGMLTSWNFLREIGKVKSGQKVLINGASGSLGTAAVQIAKYFGAHVTGVCSTRNVELVKSLGADEVIDYKTTDFTKGSERYDIVYDTIGKNTFPQCKPVLAKQGMYLSPVMKVPLLLQMMKASIIRTAQKPLFAATGLLSEEKLREMASELIEPMQNGYLKIVLDKGYTLSEIPEAHRYIESGRKRGNVVATVVPSGQTLSSFVLPQQQLPVSDR